MKTFCAGYLGDIGVPISDTPGDFSGWFEAYLGDFWWAFDARHNMPRIGRILMARKREATVVPVLDTFGQHTLERFDIITEEVKGDRYPLTLQHRREHWALNATLRGDHDIVDRA